MEPINSGIKSILMQCATHINVGKNDENPNKGSFPIIDQITAKLESQESGMDVTYADKIAGISNDVADCLGYKLGDIKMHVKSPGGREKLSAALLKLVNSDEYLSSVIARVDISEASSINGEYTVTIRQKETESSMLKVPAESLEFKEPIRRELFQRRIKF